MARVDSLNSNEVFKSQLFILGVLDDKLGWDRALIDKSQRALLLGVDFSQLKIDDRLE